MNLFKKNIFDEKIKKRIEQLYYRQQLFNAEHVLVDVKNGEVTLKGYVESFHQKEIAEDLLRFILGIEKIKLIKNDIFILDKERLQKSKRGLIDNITGLN